MSETLTTSPSAIRYFFFKHRLSIHVAVTLLDEGPMNETQLVESVLRNVEKMRQDPIVAEVFGRWPDALAADSSAVKQALSDLVEAGLLQPSAKGYKVAPKARKSVDTAITMRDLPVPAVP